MQDGSRRSHQGAPDLAARQQAAARTVLHFFPRFFPWSWGGAENYIRGLIAWQQRQGERAVLLCGFPEEGSPPGATLVRFALHSAFRYEHEGITVLCVRPYEHGLYDYALFRKVRRRAAAYVQDWRRIFRHFLGGAVCQLHVHSIERSFVYPHYLRALWEENAALRVYAHCHDPLPCVKGTLVDAAEQPCSRAAGTLACLPCSTTWRELPPPPGTLHYLKSKHDQLAALLEVFRELDRHCTAWVSHSTALAQSLRRNGIADQRIVVRRHGVDPRFLGQPAQDKPAGVTHFAYLGRFVEAKGLANLLTVWQQLPVVPARKLFLIGSADRHSGPRIRALLEALQDRPDVRLLGRKSPAEIAGILRGSIHCVLIPSLYQEIGPLVLNEALASRCAVIAAELGGLREYARDHASAAIQLFPHQDLQALRARIEHFTYRAPEPWLRFSSEEEHYRDLLAQLAALGTAPGAH